MQKYHYPVVEFKNIVAIGMLQKCQTFLSFAEIQKIINKVERNLISRDIIGVVQTPALALNNFAKEFSGYFIVDQNGISLRDEYDLQWIIDNIVNNIPLTELQYFGWFTKQNDWQKD